MRLLLVMMALVFGVPAYADSGILKVDWSAIQKKQSQISARKAPYPSVLTEGISTTRLPVYIPASLSYDTSMAVVANQNFYTISFVLEGATMLVSGDRTYQQTASAGGADVKLALPSSSIDFVRSEGMMTTEFNRHGVNYSLVVECKKPDQDQRCLQPNYLKNIYNELILVGGRP